MKQASCIVNLALLTVLPLPSLAVDLVDCPEKNDDSTVVYLQSKDSKCVRVNIEVAKQSRVLKEQIGEMGSAQAIPLPLFEDRLLQDLASIMEDAHDKSGQQKAAAHLRALGAFAKQNPSRLVRAIIGADYLNLPEILNAALSLFSKKVLEDDLPKLGSKMNEGGYKIYKQAFLTALPNELQQAVVQRGEFFPPRAVATLEHDVCPAIFSPDGRIILVQAIDGRVLWDPGVRGQNESTRTLSVRTKPALSAFSPDGRVVATIDGANHGDVTFKLWDANAEGNQNNPLAIKRLDTSRDGDAYENVTVENLIFSPDSKRVLIKMYKTLWICDTSARGDLAQSITKLGNSKYQPAFSADSKHVVAFGGDTVYLWDAKVGIENPAPLATFKVKELRSVVFSPDARFILTAQQNFASLWDSSVRGEQHQPLAKFTLKNKIAAARFSPDGNYILTESMDGARLWDAHVREENTQPLVFFKYDRHHDSVATFSVDSRLVLTTSSKKAQIWESRIRGERSEPHFQWELQPSHLFYLRFSPSSKYVIENYFAETRLMDVKRQQRIGVSWNGVVFRPDDSGFISHEKDSLLLYEFLDLSKVNLAEAQILRFASQNKLNERMLPLYLLNELGPDAKRYLRAKD